MIGLVQASTEYVTYVQNNTSRTPGVSDSVTSLGTYNHIYNYIYMVVDHNSFLLEGRSSRKKINIRESFANSMFNFRGEYIL